MQMTRGRVTAAVVAAVLLVLTGTLVAHAAYSSTPRTGTWVPNGRVNAIAVHGDRVYIGGSFTAVSDPVTGVRVGRNRLAAFDAQTGALVTEFDPSADNRVHALAVSTDGSMVYAGGDFTSVNGSPHARLAAVDASGDLVPGWGGSASGSVRDLVLQGDALYAAGKFLTPSGAGRAGIARVSASSGDVDSSWRVRAGEGRVWALALSPDRSRLVAGGSFKVIDGVRQSFLASVSVADGALTLWRPPPVCDTCHVLDVTVNANYVYAAMEGPGGTLGAWDADLDILRWRRIGDGDVQAVAYHEGVVYAGGHFGTTFAREVRSQLAAVTAADGTLREFAPPFTGDPYPGVWALDAGPDFLRVGGGFRGVESGPQARYAEFPYF